MVCLRAYCFSNIHCSYTFVVVHTYMYKEVFLAMFGEIRSIGYRIIEESNPERFVYSSLGFTSAGGDQLSISQT